MLVLECAFLLFATKITDFFIPATLRRYEKVLAIFAERCYNCIKANNERSMAMLFTYAATAVPATGNVSANVYLIAVIIAAVLIVGAVIAGIISKKKKK